VSASQNTRYLGARYAVPPSSTGNAPRQSALEEHGPPANSKPAAAVVAAAVERRGSTLPTTCGTRNTPTTVVAAGKARAYAPNDVRNSQHPNHNKMKNGAPRASRRGRPPRHIRRSIPAPVTPATPSASVPPTTLKLSATVPPAPFSQLKQSRVSKQFSSRTHTDLDLCFMTHGCHGY
jgi:hypothetical protein